MSLTHQQITNVLDQNAIAYDVIRFIDGSVKDIIFDTYTMRWCVSNYCDVFKVARESLPGLKNEQYPPVLIRYIYDLTSLLHGDHAMIKQHPFRKFITIMQPVVWAVLMVVYPNSDKIFKPGVDVDYIMFGLMGLIAAYNVCQFFEILQLKALVTFTQRKLDKVTREFETFDSL